ncbi:hypothetical protein ES703_54674 [subsurface metagenome]
MKKNTVDKRKSKLLNEDARVKYEALVRVAGSSVEHFKSQAQRYQEDIKHYGKEIEHYEAIIGDITLPAKGSLDQDPVTKEALGDLRNKVEHAQAEIQKHQSLIANTKDMIVLYEKQALKAEQELKEYRDLLAAAKDGEEKDL